MDAGLITTFHPFLNIDRSPDLERLFRDSAADLAGFFARRNEGKEQADDLVQETFLRMAEGLEKGKRPDNLRLISSASRGMSVKRRGAAPRGSRRWPMLWR